MNYQDEAKEIHSNYYNRKVVNNAFQDAVIDLLYLLVRVLIAREQSKKK